MPKFNIESLSEEQKKVRKTILEISFQRNLSHLGSCLSAIDLIDAVYKTKKAQEKFVLSNGHAGIALYVILEKNKLIKKADIKKLYIHPDRNSKLNIHVSTGSLGQGLPIALGMAIASAKQNKNVYCMISDGECAEGSVWETLRIASDKKITNLKIIVNANGWGAYDAISLKLLIKRLEGFGYDVKKVNGHDLREICRVLKESNAKPTIIFGETLVEQLPFLKGQDAHYYIMNKNNYMNAIKLLK